MFLCLVSFPLDISLQLGQFKLAQTIESLQIGEALNSLSFKKKLVIFKYQTPKNSNFELSTQFEL